MIKNKINIYTSKDGLRLTKKDYKKLEKISEENDFFIGDFLAEEKKKLKKRLSKPISITPDNIFQIFNEDKKN